MNTTSVHLSPIPSPPLFGSQVSDVQICNDGASDGVDEATLMSAADVGKEMDKLDAQETGGETAGSNDNGTASSAVSDAASVQATSC